MSIVGSLVTGETDDAGRFVSSIPATIRVRPLPFVTELHMIGDHQIGGNPGKPATGSTSVVIFSLGDNGDGGVSGLQYSLGYSNEIRVSDVSLADHLFESLGTVSTSNFATIEFSPDGVDPNEVYGPGDAVDPECELEPGEPQGNGIVVSATFDLLSSGESSLPTSGTFGMLDIEYEQTVPFETGEEDPQTSRFEWRDCLRGSASPVKTGLTVRGHTILPRLRTITS